MMSDVEMGTGSAVEAEGAPAKDNIVVCVRVRPMNRRETERLSKTCVRIENDDTVHLPNNKSFTFDYVAGEDSTQEGIFKNVGLPVADNFLRGYNGTIFAYGQTGSGKTFTVQGATGASVNDLFVSPERGITPRILQYLFTKIKLDIQNNPGVTYSLKVSFIEIYKEKLKDLLNPHSNNLVIRDDSRVENATEVEIETAQEGYTLLLAALKNRHVAATNSNDESSRSHSIMQLMMVRKSTSTRPANTRGGAPANVVQQTERKSRLNIVDLAGSERQQKTGAKGVQLEEASHINKSLSVLGSVINSLVKVAKGCKVHIRYRDSKLTYLLKDSLGGNSKTSIIAAISPSDYCFSETLSTLRFAQNAKGVQNKAVINEDSRDFRELQAEIRRLRSQLASFQSSSSSSLLIQQPPLPSQIASLDQPGLSMISDSPLVSTQLSAARSTGRNRAALLLQDQTFELMKTLQDQLRTMVETESQINQERQQLQMTLERLNVASSIQQTMSRMIDELFSGELPSVLRSLTSSSTENAARHLMDQLQHFQSSFPPLVRLESENAQLRQRLSQIEMELEDQSRGSRRSQFTIAMEELRIHLATDLLAILSGIERQFENGQDPLSALHSFVSQNAGLSSPSRVSSQTDNSNQNAPEKLQRVLQSPMRHLQGLQNVSDMIPSGMVSPRLTNKQKQFFEVQRMLWKNSQNSSRPSPPPSQGENVISTEEHDLIVEELRQQMQQMREQHEREMEQKDLQVKELKKNLKETVSIQEKILEEMKSRDEEVQQSRTHQEQIAQMENEIYVLREDLEVHAATKAFVQTEYEELQRKHQETLDDVAQLMKQLEEQDLVLDSQKRLLEQQQTVLVEGSGGASDRSGQQLAIAQKFSEQQQELLYLQQVEMNLRAEVDEHRERSQSLEASLNDTLRTQSTLKQVLQEQTDQLEKLSDLLDEKNSSIEKLQSLVDEIQEEVESVQQQNTTLEEEKLLLLTNMERMIDESHRVDQMQEEQQQKLIDQFNSVRDELLSQVNSLRGDRDKLASQNGQHTLHIQRLCDRIAEIEEHYERAQHIQGRDMQSFFQKEIGSREEQIDRMQQTLEKMQQRTENLESERSTLLQSMNAESQLRDLLTHQTQQISSMKVLLHEEQSERMRLQDLERFYNETRVHLDRTSAELREVKERNSQLEQHVLHLDQSGAADRQEVQQLRERCKTGEEQLKQLVDKVSSQEEHLAQFRESNKSMTQRINELEGLSQEQQSLLEALHHEKGLLSSEVQRLQSVSDQHMDLLRQFEIELATALEAEKFMNDEILRIEALKNDMEEKLIIAGRLNQEHEQTISKLEAQNVALLGHQNPKQKIHILTTIKQENMNLKRQLKEMQAELIKRREVSLRNSTKSSSSSNVSMSPVLLDKENMLS